MNKGNFGFTLVELLLVIMVISILLAIATPVVFTARKKASVARAMKDVRSIEAAVMAYYETYGKLPIPSNKHNSPEPEYFTGLHSGDSKDIIYALAGYGDGEISNSKNKLFLNVPDVDKINNSSASGWKGEFEDPWNNQYEIKLDADYNGKVNFFSDNKETVDCMVVAISRGPDGKPSSAGEWNQKLNRIPTDEIMSYIIPKPE